MNAPVLLASLLTFAGAATAEPGFRLEWRAPPCAPAPDAPALLGPAARGAARVELGERDGRWFLVVTFEAPHPGERRLDASSCAEAARAAELLLRLGATAPPAAPPVTAAVASTSDWWFLGGGAAVERVSADGWSPALALTALRATREATFGVEATFGSPVRVPWGPTPAAQIAVRPLAALSVVACLDPLRSRVTLGLCARTAGAAWELDGVNVLRPGAGLAPVVEVGLEARAVVLVAGPLAVAFAAGAAWRVVRPAAFFLGYDPAWDGGPLAAQVQLTVGWRG